MPTGTLVQLSGFDEIGAIGATQGTTEAIRPFVYYEVFQKISIGAKSYPELPGCYGVIHGVTPLCG